MIHYPVNHNPVLRNYPELSNLTQPSSIKISSSTFCFINTYQNLTASGQILSPPLLSHIACSLTGVPVCAALTISPALIKIPTCATLFTQSPPSPQNSISPGRASERGMCLPSEEWYCVWAVRGMVMRRAWQVAYWVRPEQSKPPPEGPEQPPPPQTYGRPSSLTAALTMAWPEPPVVCGGGGEGGEGAERQHCCPCKVASDQEGDVRESRT